VPYALYANNTNSSVSSSGDTLFIGNATVNATVNSTTFSGVSLTANNATYLGGVIAASYIFSTANINFTSSNIYFGNATTTSNVYFQNNSVIYANNRFGTVNQLLASNGTSMYWADASAISANQLYAFTWTNTHTHGNTTQQANVVYANGVIIAFGSCTSNQFTVYFDVTTSPNTYGWGSSVSACAGTGTPLTVYITGTASSLFEAVVTLGKVLYTNVGLTTPLNGNNTHYKTVSAPALGETLLIDGVGVTSSWGGPC
jgi:hypothetical protein